VRELHRRPARNFAGLLAFLLVNAAAAQDDDPQALWNDAAPVNYVYAYQKYCDCHRDTPPQTFVTVESGRIVRVYHRHADSEREVPAREGSLDLYWTVDDLFSLVKAAAERGVTYTAEYDEIVGYPTRIYIDYDPAAVGEEIDIRLTSFEIRD